MRAIFVKLIYVSALCFCTSLVEAQHDVRKTSWGMSSKQVISAEYPSNFIYNDVKAGESFGEITYLAEINGSNAYIKYHFAEDRLISVDYLMLFTYDWVESPNKLSEKVQVNKYIYENLREKGFVQKGSCFKHDYLSKFAKECYSSDLCQLNPHSIDKFEDCVNKILDKQTGLGGTDFFTTYFEGKRTDVIITYFSKRNDISTKKSLQKNPNKDQSWKVRWASRVSFEATKELFDKLKVKSF